MSDENLSCSFCGISKVQTKILVAGEDAHICDQCIEQANGIILQESKEEKSTESKESELLKPQQIKSFLDDYIVGQDYKKVYADSDRDYWMKSDKALEYGMIDEILTKQK